MDKKTEMQILLNQQTILAVLRDVAEDHHKAGYLSNLNKRYDETKIRLDVLRGKDE